MFNLPNCVNSIQRIIYLVDYKTVVSGTCSLSTYVALQLFLGGFISLGVNVCNVVNIKEDQGSDANTSLFKHFNIIITSLTFAILLPIIPYLIKFCSIAEYYCNLINVASNFLVLYVIAPFKNVLGNDKLMQSARQ